MIDNDNVRPLARYILACCNIAHPLTLHLLKYLGLYLEYKKILTNFFFQILELKINCLSIYLLTSNNVCQVFAIKHQSINQYHFVTGKEKHGIC